MFKGSLSSSSSSSSSSVCERGQKIVQRHIGFSSSSLPLHFWFRITWGFKMWCKLWPELYHSCELSSTNKEEPLPNFCRGHRIDPSLFERQMMCPLVITSSLVLSQFGPALVKMLLTDLFSNVLNCIFLRKFIISRRQKVQWKATLHGEALWILRIFLKKNHQICILNKSQLPGWTDDLANQWTNPPF